MHHTLIMKVFERVAELQSDAEGAIRRKRARLEFRQNLAKRATFRPLHHHVRPAPPGIGQEFHDCGVIQSPPDLLLALQALGEKSVSLDCKVRKFYGNLSAGVLVGALVNAGRGTGGNQSIESVVVDLSEVLSSGGVVSIQPGVHPLYDRNLAGKKS
jgi:hypothetical protein